jgi:hypothetical protein
MTDTVGYSPGEAWLISGASAIVMTDGDAADARRYWNLVRRNVSAAELVDGISPGPAAGALAVLVWEPSGVRVLVRGGAVVRLRLAGGARPEVTAANLLTWREELFADVTEVEVVPAERDLPINTPDDSDLLPVPAGVVRAAFARRRTDDQPTSVEIAETAGAVDPEPEPVVTAEPEPVEPAEPEPVAPAEPEPIDENVVGDDAVTVISTVPASAREVPAATIAPVSKPAATPATSDATPVSPEGDRADKAVRHRAPDVTQSVPLDYEEDPELDRVPSAEPWEANSPGGSAPAPDLLPGPPEPGHPEPVLGDHDGITELAEDLPAGFTPPPLPPALAVGWVYAALCPSGHVNQPHTGNCRICGQPIPPGDPVAAPQPLLGRLRFSTGELIDLDRRVIIGRAPSVSRVSSSELPRLVTVPSPQQDISRSHAEVRIEDWHVVVADLHSTNGTVLRAPDRPEQLLHPGQEMVIEPGWTVDLGDGVTVAVEAAG